MPIKDAVYDQLSFDIVVERENPAGGLSAAGQVITSKVHQVMFCKAETAGTKGAIATAIEGALA